MQNGSVRFLAETCPSSSAWCLLAKRLAWVVTIGMDAPSYHVASSQSHSLDSASNDVWLLVTIEAIQHKVFRGHFRNKLLMWCQIMIAIYSKINNLPQKNAKTYVNKQNPFACWRMFTPSNFPLAVSILALHTGQNNMPLSSQTNAISWSVKPTALQNIYVLMFKHCLLKRKR